MSRRMAEATDRRGEFVLVVLGTDHHPFDRAVDIVGTLRPAHRLVVQHGHTPARDWPGVEWHEFLAFETLRGLVRDAAAVVCHGGVGSIMTALSFRRRPVVIARLAAHGEHVDDHQLQIVAKLGGEEIIAVFRERHQFKPGDKIRLKPDPRLIHLFDEATGKRLGT